MNVTGIPPLSHFSFSHENERAICTLFTQMMLDRGFLATNSFYATYAHQEPQIDQYLFSVEETFRYLAIAIERDTVEQELRGPVAHNGFQRLT